MHQLPLRSETVEDFFFEPIGIRHNVIKLKGWSSYGIRKFGNGMASLEFGKCRIEYREKDGFVFRDLRRFEAGDYYKERLQYLPAEIGESTAAAKLIVDITYAKGVSDTVQRVQMYSLRHVGVNKSMDSNTFKLQAPKGTKIVKFTERAPVIPGSDVRPSIEVANDKLDDVGSFVEKNGFGATGVPMSSRTTVP